MAKDERLYMTFPNDIHRHPKLSRISVDARWAFVEMNGEARINDNDGVFSVDDAEFMWAPEVLAELVGSHPSKPLVQRVGDTYVIREYAKHQQTKADREVLSQKRSEAGKAGAAARWGNDGKAMASAKQVPGKPKQAIPESESESELPDLLLTESVSLGSNSDEKDLTDSEEDPESVEACLRLAVGHNLELPRIIELADHHCARRITHQQALVLGQHITSKSKNRLKNPMSYVTSTFKNSAAEVQQAIDRGMA